MTAQAKALSQLGDLCGVVATMARLASDPESLLATAESPMRALRDALALLLGEEEAPAPAVENAMLAEPRPPEPIEEDQWWAQMLELGDAENLLTLERRSDATVTATSYDEDGIVIVWLSEPEVERASAWLRREPLLPPIRKDDAGMILDDDEPRVLAYLQAWGDREPVQALPVRVAKPLVERGLLRKVDAVAGLYPPSWCVRAVEPAVEPA